MGMLSELLAVYTRRPVRFLRPERELERSARATLVGLAGLALWKKYRLAKAGVDRFASSLDEGGRRWFEGWLENVATVPLAEAMYGFLGLQKIWGYGSENLLYFARAYRELRRPCGDELGNQDATFDECWNRPPGWVATQEGLSSDAKDGEAILAGRYDGAQVSVDEWLAKQGIEPRKVVALAFWEYEEPTFFFVAFGYSEDSSTTLELLGKGYSRWRPPKPLPTEGEDFWDSDEYRDRNQRKRRRLRQRILLREYERSERLWYKRLATHVP